MVLERIRAGHADRQEEPMLVETPLVETPLVGAPRNGVLS
jgi:hypothetical protein